MATPLPALVDACEGMSTASFLSHLIRDTFPGKVLVTASLRARSIATLRMIADIEPATPVVFCHVKNVFQESLDYRAEIIDALGLTDVRTPALDSGAVDDDCYHSEALWAEDPIDGTHTYTTIPLNETLKDFECWISAVYHGPYSDAPRPRLVEEGRLVRADPLVGWSKDEVRGYLKERNLPFHPKAMQRMHKPAPPLPIIPGHDYHY